MSNLKKIILFGIGLVFFNVAKAESIKGCISNFIQGVSSGNSEASANFNNCISGVSGSSGGSGHGGQDQDTYAGEPEPLEPDMPIFEMNSLLAYTGISNLPTASEQIIEFENYFAPALQVIRNVDVTGLNQDEALVNLIGYVIDNNLINIFYNNGNFVLYPSIMYGLLVIYVNSGNNQNPPSWTALGYTLD